MSMPKLPPKPAAPSLAIAMVHSSPVPLLLLDGDLVVVAASASFCRDFGVDPTKIDDRPVFSLGTGEWDSPRLRSLLHATGSGGAEVDAYELDLRTRAGVRRLVIDARRLNHGDDDGLRLLVTIEDVTDVRVHDRELDDLVREKAILLQELQHRVANSLQIIASVLMQSARNTLSEESRGHLNDAHHRVMSVAAVQRQLARSTLGEVALRPYLGELCKSIGASMIHDPAQLAIDVEVDDSNVAANVSVSLGLIVTELVINALKHAFPQHRHGTITVAYRAVGTGWTLSVADDGVGIPTGDFAAKAGLGTTIVEALAKQLGAEITTAGRAPGTGVTISRAALRLVAGAGGKAA